jgi:hypothetical protein
MSTWLVLRWEEQAGTAPILAEGTDAHYLLSALDRAQREHAAGEPRLWRRGLKGEEESVAAGQAVFSYLRGLICC